MSKHLTKLEIHTRTNDAAYVVTVDPLELANTLAGLRYDALATYVARLATKLQIDADMDASNDRGKLAGCLNRAACAMDKVRAALEEAWEICEPMIEHRT